MQSSAATHHPNGPSKRRKKKRGMKPADPAAKVIKGFDTPVTSGGEESDYSSVGTPRLSAVARTPVTAAQTPESRPTSALTRAISTLKLGDAAISDSPREHRKASLLSESRTSSRRSNASSSSKSDLVSEPESMQLDSSAEPITRDFAAADGAGPSDKPIYASHLAEGGLRHDSPHRKMTATDFEPLKCLGKGAYGTVLLVKQHSTGRLFAQKQLKKERVTTHEHLVEMTKSERAILESVNRHPFVVKLFYAFQDHAKLYLILEYAQGGELFHHLAQERMFSEEVAAFYMAEMVLALDHLHRNLGVVYRDLKPENCLLDSEGHLLITDFGLSKVADTECGTMRCDSMGVGTIDYMAPEIVLGKPYDSAVDWWSLGALGYDLLTGAPPFASQNHAKTQQKIVHGKPSMPYYLGPDSKDLLTRLLRKEPRKRLGGNMPKDLATIKSHRFFRRIDWKKLERREVEAPITPIITDPAEAENFSKDFTDLAMSPVDARGGFLGGKADAMEMDPFGGFSYVASSSLLEHSMLDNAVF